MKMQKKPRTRMRELAGWCSVIALMTGVFAGAQEPATKEARPAVLFAGTARGHCEYELARHLQKAGFDLRAMPDPALRAGPLTWDQVKSFNVLVLDGLGQANADMTLSENNTQTLDVLKRFLAEGGGVLMFGAFGGQVTVKPPQDAFLKPLGLTPLFDEMPDDADTATVATSWNIPFALGTPKAGSPVTEGVQALWYPAPRKRIASQNHTVSFTVSDDWTVQVTGSRTSRTWKGPLQDPKPEGQGTYSRDVPLVATREAGPGRLCYLGITHEYLTGAHAETTLEGIVLERGLRGTPSGGRQLLVNTLEWLAAPSLESGKLGGAGMDETLLRNPDKVRLGKPFAWPETVTFPAVEVAYPGVIGARTSYSTGSATADAWAAAARSAGLSYLVFLEDFAHLTADEFGQLKADCGRLTDDELVLVPGFTIDDEIGNHYFYFGTTFPYPDAKFLTADGTRFRSRDPALDRKNPYQPGQLSMTVLDYAYSTNSFKQTCGNYLFSRDAAPFADFFSNWDATGVVTARDGEVLEDATDDFLQLVDSGQGPLPLAFDLMDAPEQLAQTPWRTVLKFPAEGGTMVGGFPINQKTRIQDYFNSWHFYPDNPSRIYITSGPEILSWCYTGSRDYGGNNPDNFVWENYRWQLRGLVRAPAGLAEVAVYDGPVLFRRFLPKGKAEFEFVLDLTHDRQHNLVLIATDSQGRKAISGEQWDRNARSEEFMCGDRNNQLSYGLGIRRDGTGVLLGGNQTLATPNKRIAPGISPAGTFRNDALLGAPAFDGATRGEPQAFPTVHPLGTKEPVPGPTVSQSFRLLHTGDVNIGEGREEHRFTDGIRVANVWHTLWKTEPCDTYTVTRRNHFFQVNPDSPLAVFLWRFDITLKQDIANTGFRVVQLASAKDRLWMLRGSDGQVLSGSWEEDRLGRGRSLHVPFGLGAYTALLDSPLGGLMAFPLTEGLTASIEFSRQHGVFLDLDRASAPKKAGDNVRAEVLLVGIPRMTRYTEALAAASNETVERFYRDFGLDDGEPAYTLETASGNVESQRYILRVAGGDEQCFSAKLTGKLVSTLPIAVTGLRDRVSAYLYDRTLKKARPIGVFEGTAWATVRLEGKRDLFIGNPVLCDRSELTVQVTQTGPNGWHIEVHNPTDRDIAATLGANPHFDPLAGGMLAPRQVTVAPGASVTFSVGR